MSPRPGMRPGKSYIVLKLHVATMGEAQKRLTELHKEKRDTKGNAWRIRRNLTRVPSQPLYDIIDEQHVIVGTTPAYWTAELSDDDRDD